MGARLGGIVLDAPDPGALADFYRQLLGWREVSRDDDWVMLRDQGRPVLSFQLAPDYVAPEWPSRLGAQQMQSHLDIHADDLETEVARAVALGASVAEEQPQPEGIRVMQDPAGHVFCLFIDGY